MEKETLLNQIIAWAETQNEIAAIYLYGSVADGLANALSDLDIAILADFSFDQALLWEKENEWAANWPDFVDLRLLNFAPVDFQFEVITHGKRIWERDIALLAEVESLIRRKYWDIQPLIKKNWKSFQLSIMESKSGLEPAQYQATLDQVRAVHYRIREASKPVSDPTPR